MNPFDYINSISYLKQDIDTSDLSDYNPWITMNYFSNFNDTVAIANALNCLEGELSKKMHFLFLNKMINPKRRFGKSEKNPYIKDARVVADYFNCSVKRAIEIIKILSNEDLEEIKNRMKK